MQPNEFYNNSVYWIELDKIKPNPFQPRKEFDEGKLAELADSIRQYGVLQPIVLTRKEVMHDDGGLSVEYELISGERRHRAAKLAGISQIPAVIRAQEDSDRTKLELAIIENLQREDLNPIDRALAFNRLQEEFNFKHTEIAKKVGRSREYVSNTLRLLALPDLVRDALVGKQISEGHARSLLMLSDRPDELTTLFKEIVYRKLSVRETEQVARRMARDKIRKKADLNPDLVRLEQELTDHFGTRVQIQQKEKGGKVVIEYFSPEDFKHIVAQLQNEEQPGVVVNAPEEVQDEAPATPEAKSEEKRLTENDEADIYSIKHFSI